MKKLLSLILSRLPVAKKLQGKKVFILAATVVVSALIAMVEQLAPLFPEASWLKECHEVLVEILGYVKDAVEYLGVSLAARLGF